MFALIVYAAAKIKKIIPIQWLYADNKKIVRAKHYLAYFSKNIDAKAPPSSQLLKNVSSNELKENHLHTIWLIKLMGKYIMIVIWDIN